MNIRPIRKDILEYIAAHNLEKKWTKASTLFETNIKHPSLSTELMEPGWRGIYSFRLDKKYRAIFFVARESAEILKITNHYKK